MGLLKNVRERGLLWVFVHYGFFLLDRYIEFVLYPKSILAYGFYVGVGLMMALSFFLCLALIGLYDLVGRSVGKMPEGSVRRRVMLTLSDALGFETLKEAGEGVFDFFFGKVTIAKSDTLRGKACNLLKQVWEAVRRFIVAPVIRLVWPVFLFLFTSVIMDPMTCTILLRPANQYRMRKTDWAVFIASVVVSCGVFGFLMDRGMALLQMHAPELWRVTETVLGWFP